MTFRPDIAEYLRRYALCLGMLAVSLVLLPLLALAPALLPFIPSVGPAALRNALFFWPQYLLLPNGLVAEPAGTAYLGDGAIYIAAAFWLAALGVYVRITRGLRLRWVALALLPAVALAAEIAMRVLSANGFRPLLEGL
jgi:hypothetical protein